MNLTALGLGDLKVKFNTRLVAPQKVATTTLGLTKFYYPKVLCGNVCRKPNIYVLKFKLKGLKDCVRVLMCFVSKLYCVD